MTETTSRPTSSKLPPAFPKATAWFGTPGGSKLVEIRRYDTRYANTIYVFYNYLLLQEPSFFEVVEKNTVISKKAGF